MPNEILRVSKDIEFEVVDALPQKSYPKEKINRAVGNL